MSLSQIQHYHKSYDLSKCYLDYSISGFKQILLNASNYFRLHHLVLNWPSSVQQSERADTRWSLHRLLSNSLHTRSHDGSAIGVALVSMGTMVPLGKLVRPEQY